MKRASDKSLPPADFGGASPEDRRPSPIDLSADKVSGTQGPGTGTASVGGRESRRSTDEDEIAAEFHRAAGRQGRHV